MKQMKENPWTKLKDKFNINDTFETEIVNIVDFGIFVKVIDACFFGPQVGHMMLTTMRITADRFF